MRLLLAVGGFTMKTQRLTERFRIRRRGNMSEEELNKLYEGLSDLEKAEFKRSLDFYKTKDLA
jgi:hypothetical protein